MPNRKIEKIVKRLTNLPKGKNFFKYSGNKLSHFHKKATKQTSVASPSTIMIEVTNRCNLKCITCPREYQYGKEMNQGHIEFDLLTKIVDEVYPQIDSIGLTGLGEPLLYKKLPEALSYIKNKSKGIITSLSTNANLPQTPQIVESIKHNMDTIQISMDGIGETYEKIRKNSNYSLFIENVKKIIEITANSETHIMFNMVVIKENYHQMIDVINLCDELGVDTLDLTLFNLASITEHDVNYYDFYKSDDFKAALRKAVARSKELAHREISFWDYESENGFNKCSYPWNHFYITWDGFVPPCCAKPFPKELSFGDVKEKPLMDSLNSKGFQNFRKMWFENKTPDFCKKCHIIDLPPIKL